MIDSKDAALVPDRARWEALKDRLLTTFRDELQGKSVVYIDYPLHLNLGDLLIYKGTVELLKELDCNVVASYSIRNSGALFKKNYPKDTVMLLHGGGNFGDIYPVHQNLREKVASHFTENPVLVMPQSVHFNDPIAFEEDSKVFRDHPNLKMYVRDVESYQFMSGYLKEGQCHLAPDMATTLIGSWQWQDVLPDSNLLFRRQDCESINSAEEIVGTFDWQALYSRTHLSIYQLIGKLSSLERRLNINLYSADCWRWFTNKLIERAVNHYRQFGSVDTDRLHGLILAQLLGRPVQMSDNSYKKIERYVSCWLT